MTAEEFAGLYRRDVRTELVRGEVVESPLPCPRYGEVCTNILLALAEGDGIDERGHLLARSGVVTQRNPDTVRGPDVLF